MDETKLLAAIAYFEDAIRESDEIMEGCTPSLQSELTEQKGHFVVALEAMRRAPLPDNKALTNADRIRAMGDEELAVTLMCPNEMGLAEIPCDHDDGKNCCVCLLNWLKQPAGEG